LSGSFQRTVDFDPSAGVASRTAVGGSDIFLIKLSNDLASSGYEPGAAHMLIKDSCHAQEFMRIRTMHSFGMPTPKS